MQKEFSDKGVASTAEVHFINDATDIFVNADAVFYLLNEDNLQADAEQLMNAHIPVLVNAVVTLSNQLPANCIRINGWPGFLNRPVIEVFAQPATEHIASKVLHAMGWQYKLVPDVAGLIGARIISSIINEAYFALGDEVSDKQNIDTAMKLGTNYPYGPFEWAALIGLNNIRNLLNALSTTDGIYTPSPLLLKEIIE